MDQFATAFEDCDSLFVLDIYAASEPPIEGITGELLARQISEEGKRPARYVASFADAVASAVAAAQPGDMILTLGAGSVSQLGPYDPGKTAIKTNHVGPDAPVRAGERSSPGFP